jgi:hypothetical protein
VKRANKEANEEDRRFGIAVESLDPATDELFVDEVEKFHKDKVKETFAKLEPVESDQESDEISDVRL